MALRSISPSLKLLRQHLPLGTCVALCSIASSLKLLRQHLPLLFFRCQQLCSHPPKHKIFIWISSTQDLYSPLCAELQLHFSSFSDSISAQNLNSPPASLLKQLRWHSPFLQLLRQHLLCAEFLPRFSISPASPTASLLKQLR